MTVTSSIVCGRAHPYIMSPKPCWRRNAFPESGKVVTGLGGCAQQGESAPAACCIARHCHGENTRRTSPDLAARLSAGDAIIDQSAITGETLPVVVVAGARQHRYRRSAATAPPPPYRRDRRKASRCGALRRCAARPTGRVLPDHPSSASGSNTEAAKGDVRSAEHFAGSEIPVLRPARLA
jgi:hypothetical protein